MNWRKEVTREELLEANDTQYESIVKLEQEVENLKRERGNLLIKIRNVEADVVHYSDKANEWEEEYTHASQSRDFYEGKWKEAKKSLEWESEVGQEDVVKVKELRAELNTALERVEQWKEHHDKAEEDCYYWKDNFEQLYNDVMRGVNDEDIFNKYDGESDEQIKPLEWTELETYVGKPILFKYDDDREPFVFVGSYVKSDSEMYIAME